MSCGPVDPVAEGGSSGIVGIDALAQKYVPMTIAAITVTNAEAVAMPARKTRRTCGYGCEPERSGPGASSVCVVGFVVIGWVRERRRSRTPERTRRPGEGSGAGHDVRVETLAGGRGAGERP